MRFSELNPKPSLESLQERFWTYARGKIDRERVAPTSLANILIQQMLGTTYQWLGQITTVVDQLTDLDKSSGAYLDILAKFYDLIRYPARPTRGRLQVQNLGGAPLTTGSFTNPRTGATYTATGSVAAYSTGAMSLECTTDGSLGNCAASELQSDSPSAYLPVYALSTDWIEETGRLAENDVQLRLRCRDVVAIQSNGTEDAVAARIRIATDYQVSRVSFGPNDVYPRQTYFAAQSGVSPVDPATLLPIIEQYTSGSITPVAVAASPNPIRILGTLYVTRDTDRSEIAGIITELENWVNQRPICVGGSKNRITLFSLVQLVNRLDSKQRVAVADLSVIVNGVWITDLSTLIPATIGTIYVADCSSLKIVYGDA